jgi:DnaJ-class molecular chaperone
MIAVVPTRDCRRCGGTGRVILDRSWCKADGRVPARCHICGGSGFSDYSGDATADAEQARRREEHSKPPKSSQPQTDVAAFVSTLK